MDNPVYDRQLDALPAATEAAKDSRPGPSGLGVGHYVALGVVVGLLVTAPFCILWDHGDETCRYLVVGLLFAAPFLWAFRDFPLWSWLFLLATIFLFIALDGVLLGFVTRRPEMTGWVHIGPQALGAVVCLSSVAATAGWRAALARLVTVPFGVSIGNVAMVMMTSGPPGKQPGEAIVKLAMFVVVVLALALIPFQGLLGQAGKPVETPCPGGGEPPVVGLKTKG
jgi:hypothetical protein